MNRRTFLRSLGSGLLVAAAPVLLPERRFWQVGLNAPVGRTHTYDAANIRMTLGGVEYFVKPGTRRVEFPVSYETLKAAVIADLQADIDRNFPEPNPISMKAHMMGRYDLWVEKGWVNDSSRPRFADELIVTRDEPDRLMVTMRPVLIDQMDMRASVKFTL